MFKDSQRLEILDSMPDQYDLVYISTGYVLKPEKRIMCDIEMGTIEGKLIYFYGNELPSGAGNRAVTISM